MEYIAPFDTIFYETNLALGSVASQLAMSCHVVSFSQPLDFDRALHFRSEHSSKLFPSRFFPSGLTRATLLDPPASAHQLGQTIMSRAARAVVQVTVHQRGHGHDRKGLPSKKINTDCSVLMQESLSILTTLS